MRKKNKYNAVKKTVDNITFDSTKEANRYSELKLLLRAGIIKDLTLQFRYDFVVNKILIGYYLADFRYLENGKLVVEDSKGVRTPVYKLKKKMMKAIYDIDIFET